MMTHSLLKLMTQEGKIVKGKILNEKEKSHVRHPLEEKYKEILTEK